MTLSTRAEINALLVERMEDLCRKLLPHGRVEGDWFHAENWQGDLLKTVHVNLKTGRWHVTERRWVSPGPGLVQ